MKEVNSMKIHAIPAQNKNRRGGGQMKNVRVNQPLYTHTEMSTMMVSTA